MNKNLLILSADKFSANHLISTLKELPDKNNIDLDVMVFVQNKHEHILNLIKNNAFCHFKSFLIYSGKLIYPLQILMNFFL